MKKLLYIFIPIIALITAIFAILFTPSGSNAVIKPFANNYLAEKIKKPKVKIEKLDSKYKYININATVDNGIKIDAKGDIDYFKKTFDINYKVNAQKIKVESKTLPANLNVTGQAVGSVKNFGVNGQGNAFDSNLNYKFILKNNKPESIEANINSAKIAQMLLLANQKPFIDGLAFVNIKMPSLNIQNPSGNGDIEVRDGRFNRHLISKEFNIIVPKDETFKVNFKANVNGKYIIGNGKLDATTAKLNISKITTTLDFLVSKGYFNLYIPNLSRLNNIAKQNLRGKLKANGAFYLNAKRGLKQADIATKSFGGLAKVFYSGNSLKVNLKKVSIDKIIHTISAPPYIRSGVVSGAVVVPNLKTLDGNFNIGSSGTLNPKMLKVKLPNYKYSINTKGSLKNGTIYAQKSSLVSKFAKVYLTKTKYSLLTKALTTNFSASIKELSALNRLTGQKLRGAISASGYLEQKGSSINLKTTTKSLGGVVNLHYTNSRVNANLKGVSIPKLLYMINQPHLLNSGIVNAVVKLSSVKPINGIFSVASKGAVDTKSLQKLYKINLGKNFRYALNIKTGAIKKGIVIAKPKVDTTMGSVNFSKFIYNINRSVLNAKYSISIDNLAKLEPIVEQKLNGSMSINGEIKYSPSNMLITGLAKEFGGSVNFILHNDNLTLDAAGVSVVKVVKMLNYPAFLDAISKVHFEYNIKTKKGTYRANLNDARFLNSKLVDMLKKYAHFDLSKELFSNAVITGNIDNSIVLFNLNTSSQRTKIAVKKGLINTKAQTINAKISFKLNGNDYQFKLTGPIKSPHIKPVFGGYLKEKVIEKVKDKLLGKKVKGIDLGDIKGSLKDKLKNKVSKLVPNQESNQSSPKEKLEDKAKEKLKKVVPKEVKGLFKNLLK